MSIKYSRNERREALKVYIVNVSLSVHSTGLPHEVNISMCILLCHNAVVVRKVIFAVKGRGEATVFW